MQRKILAFLGISGILMVGYLLAIAGPNPPWPLMDEASDSGLMTDPYHKTIDGRDATISADVYVGYNLIWVYENQGTNYYNYRTYHWIRVETNSQDNKMHFIREYQHDGNQLPVLMEDIPSPWEDDEQICTIKPQNSSFDPYTAVRPAPGGSVINNDPAHAQVHAEF